MEIALLVFLILLNGAFAMAEMGLTAARRTRLQMLADADIGGAREAMTLHDDPTRWLSTVQIGITSIGLLNGIVGEAAFAPGITVWLVETFALSVTLSQGLATGGVVLVITYFTILFGELVPKRIGQIYPELAARVASRPMVWLSLATKPFVYLLMSSTKAVLRLLRVGVNAGNAMTEEDINAHLDEGLGAGVIETQEHQMVRNVFRLDDRTIGSMMIPRAEIVWLDAAATPAQVLAVLERAEHSRYPVCRNGLDNVLGVAFAQTLLQQLIHGHTLSLQEGLRAPVFVPETLTGMELLEQFRATAAEVVFVVDEYGEVQGLITSRDLLEAIAGEFTSASNTDEMWAVQRADGSWLLDGLMPITELKDRLALRDLPDEDRGRYNTLAGMITLLLGRLPEVADTVDWGGWRFEVVDLEGRRVDRILVSPLALGDRE